MLRCAKIAVPHPNRFGVWISGQVRRVGESVSLSRDRDNPARPHSALGYRPPAPEAIVWPASLSNACVRPSPGARPATSAIPLASNTMLN